MYAISPQQKLRKKILRQPRDRLRPRETSYSHEHGQVSKTEETLVALKGILHIEAEVVSALPELRNSSTHDASGRVGTEPSPHRMLQHPGSQNVCASWSGGAKSPWGSFTHVLYTPVLRLMAMFERVKSEVSVHISPSTAQQLHTRATKVIPTM